MTNIKRPGHLVLLQILDLTGTFALALQGASIAAIRNLDAGGVVIISLATALGGGVVRDVLLGKTPPEAFRGWPLVTVALVGGLLTYFSFHSVEQLPEVVFIVVDALGLSLLAVAGTEKALECELTPIAAVMLGTISGVGGYIIRDVLLAEVPAIFRVDFIATAAVIGSIVLVILRKLDVRANVAAMLGGATCFILRLIAVWEHWYLPAVKLH